MVGARRVLGKTLYDWTMRKTAYGHFVAGDDLASLCKVADVLGQDNVQCMYYPHMESDEGGESM